MGYHYPESTTRLSKSHARNSKSVKETKGIISSNIEGVKSNASFLQSLQDTNNIICIQEHYLWSFVKNYIQTVLPNMASHIRCHDHVEPLPGIKLPRGRRGVAILRPEMWSSRIKRLDEGNERVIAVAVAASRPICLINTYLPPQDTGSQVEYSEFLYIVHSLFSKFQGLYGVILCGDLNGTLLDSEFIKNDKLLKKITGELQLSTGIKCGNKPTLFHHMGTSKPQTDYILVQDKSLISSYTILNKSPICSSAHAPVRAILTTAIHNVCHSINQRQKKIVKLNWEWADRQSYRQSLATELAPLNNKDSLDHQVSNFTESLIRASYFSVHKKTINLKCPRWKASPKVKQSFKICENSCTLN